MTRRKAPLSSGARTAPGAPAAEVTIVLPAYDEAASIRAGRLERVLAWSRAQAPPAGVLVVDDGSLDGTAELAATAGARVLRIPHGGKAAALRAGIHAASGRWVLFSDMDQATPIEEAPKLLEALASGADVAVGSRGFARPGAPPGRFAMSLGHWALRRLLLGLRWKDTQCGFKAFRREAVVEILSRLSVYGSGRRESGGVPSVTSGFDVEMLLAAQDMGMQIREVPVSWHYRDTRRVAKLRDSLRGAADLFAIAAARRKGLYGGTRRKGGATPPAPPPGSPRVRWALPALALLAFAACAWSLLCVRSASHYRLGQEALRDGAPMVAAREYESAIGFHAPLNPYSRAAAERMLELARREEPGEPAVSAEILDRLRRALRSTRWLVQPHQHLLIAAGGGTGTPASRDPSATLFLASLAALGIGFGVAVGAPWLRVKTRVKGLLAAAGFVAWAVLLYLC